MAGRSIERLSARKAETLKTVGRHADGANLYLSIGSAGQRRWVFMYKERGTGRVREMGLGSAGKAGISLAEARRKAAAARRLLADGVDPLADKRSRRAASVTMTFGEFADMYIETITKNFKNDVHIKQWRSSLRDHASSLRSIAINQISTDHVLRVLEPIWDSTHETAKRVQGRLARILDAAKARGLRTGDNPARWNGHLKELLGSRKGVKQHHAAIPYPEMPAFMQTLRSLKSVSAVALEFTVLTAARTGEVLGASWDEIDVEQRLWTIPASRMKAKREHRVPLSDRALAILAPLKLPNTAGSDLIFPGAKKGAALSNMAMLQVLRGLYAGATVHGFRSSFRDWAGDKTAFSKETIEFSLAHVIGDKAEAAYRRGDALEKRRGLMNEWSNYLRGQSA